MAHGEPPVGPSHDLPPRDEQQLAHPLRPRPAVAVGHGLELAQQMGARLMPAAVVGEVRLPAIVDDDASVPGDDPDVVNGLASALPVQPLDGDRAAGTDVDPVVPSVHPQRGLVDVQHGHREELADRGGLPGLQRLVQARDEAEKRGLGEQPSGHRLDHGRGPPEPCPLKGGPSTDIPCRDAVPDDVVECLAAEPRCRVRVRKSD